MSFKYGKPKYNQDYIVHIRQMKQNSRNPVSFISFGGDMSVSESIGRYYSNRILMTNNGVINDGVHRQPKCPPAIVN